jgi:ABC-2 type transport system permease protein
VLARYQDQLVRQQALIDKLQFLSPALLAENAFADSAGTGLSRHHWFFAQATAHHGQLRAFLTRAPCARRSLPPGTRCWLSNMSKSRPARSVRVGIAIAALLLASLALGLSAWRTLTEENPNAG